MLYNDILKLKFVNSKFDPNSRQKPSRKPSKNEFYPSSTGVLKLSE